MRTTSRLFRTVLVAAGVMALSATAAQAKPTGPANAPEHDPVGAYMAAHHQLPFELRSSGGPVVLHKSGFVVGHKLGFAAPQPMPAAVDSPTDQTAPLVIAQPVSAQSADNGFGWTDAAIGALIASVVLILAAIAATIVRPRQTLQL
jgi:hypothetical protein